MKTTYSNMRVGILLIVVLVVTSKSFVAGQISKNTISDIIVSVPQSAFACYSGQNIDIKYSLENISAETKTFTYNRYDSVFNHVILSHTPYDIEIAATKRSAKVFPYFSSYSQKQIKAGEKIHMQLNTVNLYFDFSLDGTYELQINPRLMLGKVSQIQEVSFPELTRMNEIVVASLLSSKIKIVIDNSTVNFEKVSSSMNKPAWIQYEHGISLSFQTDQTHYKEYGPVFLYLATKNGSHYDLSMATDMKNIFDSYELTLLTPGQSLDFRHRQEDNSRNGIIHIDPTGPQKPVQKADLTLYGQKLMAEKNKMSMPAVTVKPNETVAEKIIVLNRIFDMSEDGIYGLIVSRKFIDADGKEHTVVSDPLPIRIGKTLTMLEIEKFSRQRQIEMEDRDEKTGRSIIKFRSWQYKDSDETIEGKINALSLPAFILEMKDGKKIRYDTFRQGPKDSIYCTYINYDSLPRMSEQEAKEIPAWEPKKRENLPEPVPYRSWRSPDGKMLEWAKLLSSNDNKVTVDTVDGEEKTIDIKLLSKEDKEYLKKVKEQKEKEAKQ